MCKWKWNRQAFKVKVEQEIKQWPQRADKSPTSKTTNCTLTVVFYSLLLVNGRPIASCMHFDYKKLKKKNAKYFLLPSPLSLSLLTFSISWFFPLPGVVGCAMTEACQECSVFPFPLLLVEEIAHKIYSKEKETATTRDPRAATLIAIWSRRKRKRMLKKILTAKQKKTNICNILPTLACELKVNNKIHCKSSARACDGTNLFSYMPVVVVLKLV